MIKTVGLLQRREGLDPAGFRDHYENRHAPLAVRLLGFPGYQRNYPLSDEARAALGFDAFSEFWFQDEAQTTRIGELMGTEVGAQLLEDEPRFMNVPRNQTYAVSEQLYGTRPEPGKVLRALAVTRIPAGRVPGAAERELHLAEGRVRERALPGVLAALHIVPEGASMPLPPDMPEPGCIESLWLDDRSALETCNRWRSEAGAPLLWEVAESGTPVLPVPLSEDPIAALQGFHAHLYFKNAKQRAYALRLRQRIAQRFPKAVLGRVHDKAIGPHPIPMYQVAFGTDAFADIVPWLMLIHEDLSILVHPLHDDPLTEHRDHPAWIGPPVHLNLKIWERDASL